MQGAIGWFLSRVEAAFLSLSLPRHVSKVSRCLSAFTERTGRRTKIVSGHRPTHVQEQIYADSLKAGGRSGQGYRAAPPGKSKHEAGAATDVHIIGETSGDAATDARNPYYIALAAEARKVGLKPGLDFKGGLPDPYHLEEPETLEVLKQEWAAFRRVVLGALGVAAGALVLIFFLPRNYGS